MNLHFPYRFDGRGRTRESESADYIRGLIKQVLFTSCHIPRDCTVSF